MKFRTAQRMSTYVFSFLVVGSTGCDDWITSVDPESMSVNEHREEASSHAEEAKTHSEQALRLERSPKIGKTGEQSTEAHRSDGSVHDQLATAHEDAARLSEEAQELECESVPPTLRERCPFSGNFGQFVDVPGGVSVYLDDPRETQRFLARMKCHQAVGRVQGFPKMHECPLYLPGVSVETAADGRPVILTIDPIQTPASKIQRAAR